MQYLLRERGFILKTYWKTNFLITTQREFRTEFNVRNVSTKATILSLARKLETTSVVVSKSGKHRLSVSAEIFTNVRRRLESGYSYCTCQRAAKKSGLRPYRMHVVQQRKEAKTSTRIRENKRNTRNGETQKCKLTETSWETGHSIQWDKASILRKEDNLKNPQSSAVQT
ncbi:hypothetical protein C0J52_20124 [Blattella germanica]|nr:hypothetical protein C0J52_20124 [Blattella germanica]